MIADFLMDGENLAQSELLYVVRKELTQTYSGRVQRKNPFSQERFKEDTMTKKLARRCVGDGRHPVSARRRRSR
jgi:hypothetical protein